MDCRSSRARACITALARYGTMSFSEVVRSAIGFARDGFVTYPRMAELLHTYANSYARWPSSAAIYLAGGRPEVRDVLVQSDLGRTLQYIVVRQTAARSRRRVEGLRLLGTPSIAATSRERTFV
ncbi:gamma-glutamyltranspeptidase / glutathione hydrolase [Bradyrhizobium sp. Rc3b]|nr:gamma-glutamyltranspeptidase / glutathione hydrolase [Bradyrhizobium sp. Rc3b]